MGIDEERKRGRPASPTVSSLGSYLRDLRLARGWTIRDLARAVGLPASSAGYLSQMESGSKAPHSDLARRLGEQLGDPKGVFGLWAEIGGRKDPRTAAIARRELARILEDPSLTYDPRFLGYGSSRLERSRELARLEKELAVEQSDFGDTAPRWFPVPPVKRPAMRSRIEPEETRLATGFRVPILPQGVDPDTARELYLMAHSTPEVEFVRITGDALGSKRLYAPFAYRMTEASVRRVAAVLRPGDIVVISRQPVSIVEHEIYAIRHKGRVELAHAMWNGRQLLLLPDAGKNDFVVLPARGEAGLAHCVVGHMVTVVRAPA